MLTFVFILETPLDYSISDHGGYPMRFANCQYRSFKNTKLYKKSVILIINLSQSGCHLKAVKTDIFQVDCHPVNRYQPKTIRVKSE